MKFLNKKERVLDIQLTQYGKYLLSTGKFSPMYYAFFDDNIIYDQNYGGVSEVQNNIEGRIKEAPQMETQYIFSSLQSSSAQAANLIRAELNSGPGGMDQYDLEETYKDAISTQLQPEAENQYDVSFALGTADLGSQQKSAWSVNALQGDISSSNSHYSASNSSKAYSITQINMNPISYKSEVEKADDWNFDTSDTFTTAPFADGKLIRVFEDSIVLEIQEANVPFENENFEIEIFDLGDPTLLQPLYFTKKPQNIKNDILLDESEMETHDQNFKVDSTFVEYYFQVLVDNEIDEAVLCKLDPEDKAQGIFSSRMLDCKKLENQQKLNNDALYISDASEEDEDC